MTLIEILSHLISFKTLSNSKDEHKKMYTWIEKLIKDLPVHIAHEQSEGFPSLLITTQKTKTPKLWLQSHIDIVKGPSHLFTPKIENGILYGRGAYDMKFAAASFLKILLDLGDTCSNYDFGVMLTPDEEIGGRDGVKFLLDSGHTSKVCLLPDGGTDLGLEIASKGIWFFSVKVSGTSAHSSRPWEGDSAIEKLIPFLSSIQAEFNNSNFNDPEHFHPTLNIAKISSPDRTDAVAGEAEAFVDIFYTEEKEYTHYSNFIEQLAKKYDGITVDTKLHAQHFKTNSENIYSKAFQNILEKHTGKQTTFTKSHGSSDARFFSEHNIPTILTRPKGGGHHGDHEWMDIKDFERFHAIALEFTQKISKK